MLMSQSLLIQVHFESDLINHDFVNYAKSLAVFFPVHFIFDI